MDACKLDPHLHNILRDMIALDGSERQLNTASLRKVLNQTVLNEMKKQSDEFRVMFRGLQYGGSFYENLRVKHPNEFDIDMELCLPIRDNFIKVTRSEKPGFARVQVTSFEFTVYNYEVIRRVSSWFDERNYLQRTKVMCWMQSVVDVALKEAYIPAGIKVKRKTSGPAITLVINVYGDEFSVDLVPVFGFDVSKWPTRPFRQQYDIPYLEPSNKRWFVVPKSPGFFHQCPSLWRFSFHEQEKDMIKDLGNIKPVLKLMKKLRDKFNWKFLSSYYLKTVFLWEQTKQDEEFWYQGLGIVFLHMLGRLEEALREGRIDFFWDKKLNLVQNVSRKSMDNTANCISRIRNDICYHINDKPDLIFGIYGYGGNSIFAVTGRLVNEKVNFLCASVRRNVNQTIAFFYELTVKIAPILVFMFVISSVRNNSDDQEIQNQNETII